MSTQSGARVVGEGSVDEENQWLLHGYDYVIEEVGVDLLVVGDSPRTAGRDEGHTHLLVERLGELPPILACARTMRVIDGAHRLEAARLRGETTIEVVLVDVDEEEAFVLAVKANIAHGLPLSRADRTAAALRILRSHPERSDRSVARIVGLAPGTIGAIRQRSPESPSPESRSTVQNGRSNARIGRDGRARPDAQAVAEGRRKAAEILEARPDLPLRRVAEEAGLSLGTVHNVRQRLRDGQGPVPEPAGPRRPSAMPRRRRRDPRAAAWAAVRAQVIKDPAIRYAGWGRAFVQWFDTTAGAAGDWKDQVDNVPQYWLDVMIDVALSCRDEWHEFAMALESRRRGAA